MTNSKIVQVGLRYDTRGIITIAQLSEWSDGKPWNICRPTIVFGFVACHVVLTWHGRPTIVFGY